MFTYIQIRKNVTYTFTYTYTYTCTYTYTYAYTYISFAPRSITPHVFSRDYFSLCQYRLVKAS